MVNGETRPRKDSKQGRTLAQQRGKIAGRVDGANGKNKEDEMVQKHVDTYESGVEVWATGYTHQHIADHAIEDGEVWIDGWHCTEASREEDVTVWASFDTEYGMVTW